MASTNKTDFLGLNQWEADDYVLREDFNRDNALIDEAFSSAGSSELLMDIDPTGSQTVSVDLSDLDWAKYDYVLIDIFPLVTTSSSTEAPFLVRINELTQNYQQWFGTSNYADRLLDCNYNWGVQRVRLNPHRTPTAQITATIEGAQNMRTGMPKALSYANLNTVNIILGLPNYGLAPFLKGSFIKVWGVK